MKYTMDEFVAALAARPDGVNDFAPGDRVRNRRTGKVLTVTTAGIWLREFYERVPEADT